MNDLFVSFFFTDKTTKHGYACTVISHDRPISTMKDINEITNKIESEYGNENVVILNFRRMED